MVNERFGSSSQHDGRSAREASAIAVRELRPHVINISEGQLKSSGRYQTTHDDVRAIFAQHIPAWAKANVEKSEPLRIAVWAHGGLIGEQAGLAIAHKHVAWWKSNGIYPLYFVWETGWCDALKSIAASVASRLLPSGGRGFLDTVLDPLIERGSRALGGVQIWSAMKRNAQLASAADGGGSFVASQLGKFVQSQKRAIEVHAIGHSAGSIFHSHFVPAALTAGVKEIKTLQLLAPAIRVDEHNERLLPLYGKKKQGVAHTTMYTMARDLEEADNCFGLYRKSLLYLIHHALEPELRTPILGLDMSVTADRAAARAFGLDGRRGAPGEVVWSKTLLDRGRVASQATTHGGFDDDAATMGSVAARILESAEPRERYVGTGRAFDTWALSDDWLSDVDISGLRAAVTPASSAATFPISNALPAVRPMPGASNTNNTSRTRRALCVGIDSYPGRNALEGCVADSERWESVLAHHGFAVEPLHNQAATRQRIVDLLQRTLSGSRAGDHVVFQFAGHGYQVEDLDGDELNGTDQALVPVDFESGAQLIDDDLRAILQAAPEGVRITCLMDCCHSGSNTRLLGARAAPGALGGKARVLVPSSVAERERWSEAYRTSRGEVARHAALPVYAAGSSALAYGGQPANTTFNRAVGHLLGNDRMRWVSFAACQDNEQAFEHDGHGDFTRIASRIVLEHGLELSHAELERRVLEAFGSAAAQRPRLDCEASARDQPLF